MGCRWRPQLDIFSAEPWGECICMRLPTWWRLFFLTPQSSKSSLFLNAKVPKAEQQTPGLACAMWAREQERKAGWPGPLLGH